MEPLGPGCFTRSSTHEGVGLEDHRGRRDGDCCRCAQRDRGIDRAFIAWGLGLPRRSSLLDQLREIRPLQGSVPLPSRSLQRLRHPATPPAWALTCEGRSSDYLPVSRLRCRLRQRPIGAISGSRPRRTRPERSNGTTRRTDVGSRSVWGCAARGRHLPRHRPHDGTRVGPDHADDVRIPGLHAVRLALGPRRSRERTLRRLCRPPLHIGDLRPLVPRVMTSDSITRCPVAKQVPARTRLRKWAP
jgi:hypothetical protein